MIERTLYAKSWLTRPEYWSIASFNQTKNDFVLLHQREDLLRKGRISFATWWHYQLQSLHLPRYRPDILWERAARTPLPSLLARYYGNSSVGAGPVGGLSRSSLEFLPAHNDKRALTVALRQTSGTAILVPQWAAVGNRLELLRWCGN